MDYFTIIEDAYAITYSRGVFRQVKLYSRAGLIYSTYGSGFLRLSAGGATSHKDIKWDQIDLGAKTHVVDGFYLRIAK